MPTRTVGVFRSTCVCPAGHALFELVHFERLMPGYDSNRRRSPRFACGRIARLSSGGEPSAEMTLALFGARASFLDTRLTVR
jgi:hypothetical protein